jgi:hypothetical protein
MANTVNYGWALPDVGGSTGSWGTILNNAIIAIDAGAKVISDLAAAALSRAGGVMTGKIDIATSTVKRMDLGNISGAVTFDLSVAQCYTFTLAGPLTVAFSNWPAGSVVSAVMFKMTNAGNYAITWPVASPQTRWSNATTPVWTTSGTDRVAFISDDAGSTAHGIVVGLAIA